MIKFFKKIFINCWAKNDENNAFNVQQDRIKLNQQIQIMKLFSARYLIKLHFLNNDPEIPREVVHFFHFKKNIDIEILKAQMRKEIDYIITEKFAVQGMPELIGFKIATMETLDKQNVEKFTNVLCAIAVSCNGEYKSWETFPVV